MNIEEFREFCLSLPNVTEKMPFGAFRWAKDILAFYVKGKMFCFLDINKFDKCTIKCNPIEIDELKASYNAVGMPFNSSLKYWISIQFNNDIPDYEIKRLCKESYHLIYLKNKSKNGSKIKSGNDHLKHMDVIKRKPAKLTEFINEPPTLIRKERI